MALAPEAMALAGGALALGGAALRHAEAQGLLSREQAQGFRTPVHDGGDGGGGAPGGGPGSGVRQAEFHTPAYWVKKGYDNPFFSLQTHNKSGMTLPPLGSEQQGAQPHHLNPPVHTVSYNSGGVLKSSLARAVGRDPAHLHAQNPPG